MVIEGRPEMSESPFKATPEQSELATRLLAEFVNGRIAESRPQFDFASETGFTYPTVQQALNISSEQALVIQEFLVARGMLKKDFFEKLLRCPQCHSLNLRPSTHCPKCGSANIVRGRVLEHELCHYVGVEEDFVGKGGYVCPKCRVELRTAGTDYQSLGLMRKCRSCDEVFNTPQLKWRCLKCSSLTAEDRVAEVHMYSYRLDDAKRTWLEFELKPKTQLIDFLRSRGYEVLNNATVKGRSGAEHKIDILATKDDGVINYNIAIGVEMASGKIGLDKIFDFDDKAYDIGIHDKILIVVPSLERDAEKFASQQRIKILEVRDLETVLAAGNLPAGEAVPPNHFEFKSKSRLIEYLRALGYLVEENTEVLGKSGARHSIDLLATKDDGLITHHVAFGIEVSSQPVELGRIFDFDDKAYDIGIQDKVFIAVPGLTPEAKQFAARQKIRLFEVDSLEP